MAERSATVIEAVAEGRPYGGAWARLLGYLGGEVLPYALAEDKIIYPILVKDAALPRTVAETNRAHQDLRGDLAALISAPDGPRTAALAQAIDRQLQAHVARENRTVLPTLAARTELDLDVLATDLDLAIRVDRSLVAAWQDGPWLEVAPAMGTGWGHGRLNGLMMALGGPAEVGTGPPRGALVGARIGGRSAPAEAVERSRGLPGEGGESSRLGPATGKAEVDVLGAAGLPDEGSGPDSV